jgi:hypothetical protein
MIPANKSKPKHLKIEGTSHAQKPTKIAQKRHENHSSHKREIDATMKASIRSEVGFFSNGGKI